MHMYLVFLCDVPTQLLCYAYHPAFKHVLLSSNGPASHANQLSRQVVQEASISKKPIIPTQAR